MGKKQTFIVEEISRSCHFKIETTYLTLRRFNHHFRDVPTSYIKLLLPVNFNVVNVREKELIDLDLGQFSWNKNKYYVPNNKFLSCTSYPIKEAAVPTKEELLRTVLKSKSEKAPKNAEELKDKIKANTVNTNLPSFHQYPLSWDYVTFQDGRVLFSSPYANQGGLGKKIQWRKSSSDFNKIKPALAKKVSKIFVEINYGNISEVIDFDIIQDYIVNLNTPTHKKSDITLELPAHIIPKKAKAMQYNEVRNLKEIKDSTYLKNLCNKHLKDYPIFYCMETKNTKTGDSAPEKAFIFTLKVTPLKVAIVYENTLDSRSSYIFIIRKNSFSGTIQYIHEYFSSDDENKREHLAQKKKQFPLSRVFSYHRIIHNTYEQWQNDIQKCLFYIY